MNKTKICVIGGGISGISCAKILKEKGLDVEVFEKSNKLGGLISCEVHNGNLFHKVGGHVFNTKNEKVNNWFWSYFSKEKDFLSAKRNASILLDNVFVPYPIELNISRIKDKQISTNIILDLIEISNLEINKEYLNFDDFLKYNFGNTLYNLYFKPYNKKLWRKNLSSIPLNWLEGKLPMINPKEIIVKNINSQKSDGMAHQSFYYPKDGGSQFIIDRLAEGIKINYSEVSRIKYDSGLSVNSSNKKYDHIIYTGNLKEIGNLFDKSLIKKFQIFNELKKINKLRSNGTFNVLCECDKNEYSWIYLPEKKFLAHRIIMTGNFSENNNDKRLKIGRSTCVVEFSGEYKFEEVQSEISKLPFNLMPISFNFCEESYIINDFESREIINKIKVNFQKNNIHLCGRFAEWRYYNIDNCIEASMKVCDKILVDKN